MTCHGASREDLSAYLDRELEPEAVRRLERHLARCGACRAILAGWEEDRRALRRVFAGDPTGRGFDQGVMGALSPRKEISLRPPRRRVAGLLAAGLLLLALFGVLGSRSERDETVDDGEAAPVTPPPAVARADSPPRDPDRPPVPEDPLEAFALGLADDPGPCLDLLWRRDAPVADRRRAAEALLDRVTAVAPSPVEARHLGLRLVPLLHPDLDALARDAAIRALEILFDTRCGYRLAAEAPEQMEAIRAWYAELRT